MNHFLESPKSIVELKAGEVRMILVMEDQEMIRELVNSDARLITLRRWTANGISEFDTRADNVLSVRENK